MREKSRKDRVAHSTRSGSAAIVAGDERRKVVFARRDPRVARGRSDPPQAPRAISGGGIT